MAMVDCYCDYDPPSVYSSYHPKARKRHHCDECGGLILPGEKYEYVFGVWDNIASTHKTCERCETIRDWVRINIPCFCWAYGSMLDDAKQAVEDAYDRAKSEVLGLRMGLLRKLYALRKFNRERKALAS